MNQGWSAYSMISGSSAVGRHAGEPHAVLLEPALVAGVDLVAVAVALGDLGRAVDAPRCGCRARAPRRIGAEPHGAAEVAAVAALLQLVALHPLGHQSRPPAPASAPNSVEFACVDAAQVPRRLDHRHLHAEADAEIRHVALARELRRPDLALGAALAEAARHQDAVDVLEERRRVLALEHLALDPVEIDLDLVGDAAVRERLDQRFVGVLEAGVLADDGDGDLAFGIVDALVDQAPAVEVGRRFGSMPKAASTSRVEPGGVIGLRHRIDVVDVARLDHRALAHVAEQRELAPLVRAGSAGRSGTTGCRAGCRSSAVP